MLDWRDGGRRVDFVNLSVGGFGIIDGYTETELRSVYDETIATIAQDGVEEKTVFRVGAGNANGLRCLPDQPYCLRGMVAAASPGYEAGARGADLRGPRPYGGGGGCEGGRRDRGVLQPLRALRRSGASRPRGKG